MPPSSHLVPFCASGQIYSEAEHSKQSSWNFFFSYLEIGISPQWAAFSDGVSAHCPILLNHSCYPMKSSPLKKKERKEGRKEEKGSQNLKEKNPTSCEEILGLMSFLHLPQVFSPG